MPNLFDIFKAVSGTIGDRINIPKSPSPMSDENGLDGRGSFGGTDWKYRTPPFVDPHSPINAHPVSFGDNNPIQEPGLQNASFHIGPAQVPTDYTHSVGSNSVGSNPVSGDNDMDMFNRFNQIFKPEHTSSDRYNELLNEMPVREKPSKWRRAGAMIAGLGGDPKLVDQYLYGKYNRAIDDWKDKAEPMYRSAQLENTDNNTMRSAASSSLDRYLQDRRIDEQGRKIDADIADRKRRTDISDFRAKAYDYKTRNPNHTVKQDSQGYLIGIDPQGNTAGRILDGQGQPIKGSDLSDEDRLELQHNNRLGEITAAGSVNAGLERLRQGGREDLQDNRWSPLQPLTDENGKPTGKMIQVNNEGKTRVIEAPKGTVFGKSGSSNTKTPSEIEIDRKRQNNARKLAADHPELAKWIDLNSDTLMKEGADPATRKRVHDAIYGESKPDEELVEVINPKGVRVKIRKSQYQDAITNKKYKAVGAK